MKIICKYDRNEINERKFSQTSSFNHLQFGLSFNMRSTFSAYNYALVETIRLMESLVGRHISDNGMVNSDLIMSRDNLGR